MKHFVLTIGRQLGSGGRSVAKIVAAHYGINVYDKKLIDMVAEESGLSKTFFEQADEHVSRSFLHFLFAGRGTDSHHADSPLSNDALFRMQSDVIRQLAARESCIILGRCADYILRDDPDLISVYFTADMADRAQRYARHDGTTTDEARAIIAKGDRQRDDYYGYYTNRRWGDAANYQFCMNTSVLGIEATAQVLIGYIDRIIAEP